MAMTTPISKHTSTLQNHGKWKHQISKAESVHSGLETQCAPGAYMPKAWSPPVALLRTGGTLRDGPGGRKLVCRGCAWPVPFYFLATTR